MIKFLNDSGGWLNDPTDFPTDLGGHIKESNDDVGGPVRIWMWMTCISIETNSLDLKI